MIQNLLIFTASKEHFIVSPCFTVFLQIAWLRWHLTDAPYFLYGGLSGRLPRPASAAHEVWNEEFTATYEDAPGAFFHLTLHVQLIGHPGRLRMLDRFLGSVAERPNAVFQTASTIAAAVD